MRKIEVDREIINVCGANCFLIFWDREYTKWLVERYDLRIASNKFEEFMNKKRMHEPL